MLEMHNSLKVEKYYPQFWAFVAAIELIVKRLQYKQSSLDSVQQALFFSHLTGNKPAFVIYDMDGKIGRFEHRIKAACEMPGVEFVVGGLS